LATVYICTGIVLRALNLFTTVETAYGFTVELITVSAGAITINRT
jgi:hypothetical protein